MSQSIEHSSSRIHQEVLQYIIKKRVTHISNSFLRQRVRKYIWIK
jgi:hypothetical protein